MIITELLENGLVKIYSDRGVKIRQVTDRKPRYRANIVNGKIVPTLDNSISASDPLGIYDTAVDIFINGQPRFAYEETEEPIAVIESNT